MFMKRRPPGAASVKAPASKEGVTMNRAIPASRLCWLLAGAALLGTSAPGLAQEPEEIIIVGRVGPSLDDARSLSQAVSYADLDLRFQADRDELRRRLRLTARFLCEELGETSTGDAIAPSCRDAAVKDAMKRVGTIEENFAPRGTTWVRGPAWRPPYPESWVERYP
jgi:UrcA family protein